MLVGAFNQEKALVGAFSVIVKTDGSFAALVGVYHDTGGGGAASSPASHTPATSCNPSLRSNWNLHAAHTLTPQYANYTAFIAAIKNCVNFHSFFTL